MVEMSTGEWGKADLPTSIELASDRFWGAVDRTRREIVQLFASYESPQYTPLGLSYTPPRGEDIFRTPARLLFGDESESKRWRKTNTPVRPVGFLARIGSGITHLHNMLTMDDMDYYDTHAWSGARLAQSRSRTREIEVQLPRPQGSKPNLRPVLPPPNKRTYPASTYAYTAPAQAQRTGQLTVHPMPSRDYITSSLPLDTFEPPAWLIGAHSSEYQPRKNSLYDSLCIEAIGDTTDTFRIGLAAKAREKVKDTRDLYETHIAVSGNRVLISLVDPSHNDAIVSTVVWEQHEDPVELRNGQSLPLSLTDSMAICEGLETMLGRYITEAIPPEPPIRAETRGKVMQIAESIMQIRDIMGLSITSIYNLPVVA